ncbi:MAG TPA: TrkA C-terminal domain-containing protein, partial [Verrucomicrobiae bacterium]|nr:TrkA C-terminal domain-containing protein [Verrucomicrobiae bacterium]
MDLIHHILKSNPETALFASLFFGYIVGKIKIKGFSLGGVAGSLVMALLIGQLGVVVPESLKAVCFALFIYSVGFKSGPEFFGGLNRSSLKLVLSAVVQSVAALAIALVVAMLFGFGKGYAAGIGSGALTETAMMGTAADALGRMGLAKDNVTQLTSQMAVAFAVTYVFGTVGVIIFIRSVAPKLMGVDLKKSARELETHLSEGGHITRPGYITPFRPVVARAFEVSLNTCVGRKVGELAKQFDRASIELILRNDATIEPTLETMLQKGDIVGISGLLRPVMEAGESIGEEVESREALSFPVAISKVVVTSGQVAGKTLIQVRDSIGMQNLQGV